MKDLKNYLEKNPSNSIMDYLKTPEGIDMVEDFKYAMKRYNQEPNQDIENISIRVSLSRLFFYTGMVMISSVFWGFVIMVLFILAVLSSGINFKDIIMHMF